MSLRVVMPKQLGEAADCAIQYSLPLQKPGVAGQRYTYIRFPSETVTRSGYQIRRKNFAVAAAKGGTVYSLVASARSDQYNKAKEELLQRVVASFRVRQ